jgi:hypothetical protein
MDGQTKIRLFFEDGLGEFTSYLSGGDRAAWVASANFSGSGRPGSGLATTPYYRLASNSNHMMFFYDTGEKLGAMGREDNETTWKLNGERLTTLPNTMPWILDRS